MELKKLLAFIYLEGISSLYELSDNIYQGNWFVISLEGVWICAPPQEFVVKSFWRGHLCQFKLEIKSFICHYEFQLILVRQISLFLISGRSSHTSHVYRFQHTDTLVNLCHNSPIKLVTQQLVIRIVLGYHLHFREQWGLARYTLWVSSSAEST
jgi:hypothetical protein